MTKRWAGGRATPPADSERPTLTGADAATVFGRLFDREARPLHRYLARRAGAHTADDLVAETFLAAFQQRAGYDPRRATVRAWLYGIATNLLRRQIRQEVAGYRAAARAAGHVEAITEHAGRVAERVDAEARARRLADGLAALAPGDREVLLLSSWAQLDHAEVAEALAIPVGTVRSRLHRVRRRMRGLAELTEATEPGDA